MEYNKKNFDDISLLNISAELLNAISEVVERQRQKLAEVAEKSNKWLKYHGYNSFTDANSNLILKLAEANWCPYIGEITDSSVVFDIFKMIAECGNDADNFKENIDKLLLDYYDDKEITEIKNSWEKCSYDDVYKQLLAEAIDNFICKKYASTCVLLTSLYGRLIFIKTGLGFKRENGKEVEIEFDKLLLQNNDKEKFVGYLNNEVLYQCNELKDIHNDSPGRNELMHGWYNNYPSRKKALNAIIMTDFILSLPKIV